MYEIKLDSPALKRYLRYIEAKPEQVKRASHTAMRRSLKWGVTRLGRMVSEHHDIPQKVLRGRSANPENAGKRNADRIRVRNPVFTAKEPKGYIWLGTNPIAAGYIGRLRQLKTGARVKGHRFSGAFIATMKSGHQGIFRREGEGRLGIDQQTVELHTADQIVAYINRQLPIRLRTQMDQQLRYQLRVRRS